METLERKHVDSSKHCMPLRLVAKKRKKRNRQIVHPLISCGGWIKDMPKSLPNVDVPSIIEPGQKLNKEELRDHICYEGLGFCIQTLISADKIEDTEICEQWKIVQDEMDKLVTILMKD